MAVLHLAFFLFVVGGTIAIFTTPRLARNVTFRLLHVLADIGIRRSGSANYELPTTN